ncbi:MAG: hypothetical protein N2205_06725, partial [Candidatus Caldatribacterium sp.]|nr:hypothetical protein [Candidatus Caldatribacterium sp.]
RQMCIRDSLWAVLYNGNAPIDWERCFFVRFKDCNFPKAYVTWNLLAKDGIQFLELESKVFAWSVCLELPEGFSPEDNYFDLFPEVKRHIRIEGRRPLQAEDIRILWSND